ncbi:MAG: hypothetical protein QOE34_627 [Verrucomicrobiota bacterium]|jgi:hypothetical protein
MHIHPIHRRIGLFFAVIFCLSFVAASSWATMVTWDLNPSNQNAAVGSSSHTYTSQSFSIIAYGFDNHGGVGTPHELFYKNAMDDAGAVERGLGLVGTPHNELQVTLTGPANFIQFDLTSLITSGFTNGKISVGSIQAGESFAIYGSNAVGTLGLQLGGTYGSTFDNQSIVLPNFGQYDFYSIVAATADVLPVSISAELPAVPEMNAMWPIVALMLVLVSTHAWRRRAAKNA